MNPKTYRIQKSIVNPQNLPRIHKSIVNPEIHRESIIFQPYIFIQATPPPSLGIGLENQGVGTSQVKSLRGRGHLVPDLGFFDRGNLEKTK